MHPPRPPHSSPITFSKIGQTRFGIAYPQTGELVEENLVPSPPARTTVSEWFFSAVVRKLGKNVTDVARHPGGVPKTWLQPCQRFGRQYASHLPCPYAAVRETGGLARPHIHKGVRAGRLGFRPQMTYRAACEWKVRHSR